MTAQLILMYCAHGIRLERPCLMCREKPRIDPPQVTLNRMAAGVSTASAAIRYHLQRVLGPGFERRFPPEVDTFTATRMLGPHFYAWNTWAALTRARKAAAEQGFVL